MTRTGTVTIPLAEKCLLEPPRSILDGKFSCLCGLFPVHVPVQISYATRYLRDFKLTVTGLYRSKIPPTLRYSGVEQNVPIYYSGTGSCVRQEQNTVFYCLYRYTL